MFITKCVRLRRLLNLKSSLDVPRRLIYIDLTSKKVVLPLATKILLDQSIKSGENSTVDVAKFEKACEETLQSLTDYFEELVENAGHLNSADVSYSSGVLTVNFGTPYGTYVINRQSPNKQIWLSSPTSGPKRYDFVPDGEYWLYRHDGRTLHQLLQEEIAKIVDSEVDFSKCSYSRI